PRKPARAADTESFVYIWRTRHGCTWLRFRAARRPQFLYRPRPFPGLAELVHDAAAGGGRGGDGVFGDEEWPHRRRSALHAGGVGAADHRDTGATFDRWRIHLGGDSHGDPGRLRGTR